MGGSLGRKSYKGVSWKQYWRSKQFVKTDSGRWWVVIFSRHDGEVCSLPGRFCVYEGGSPTAGLVLCFLHGAGYSGLTWSLLARELAQLVDCRLLALDLRGHGETETVEELELAGERMVKDVSSVLSTLYSGQEVGVVLVGHSMGGALAALLAEAGGVPGLLGLVVEDVVEGTALEALAGMHTVLQNRPKQFQSVEQAVEWAVRSGQVKNLESARVSMPGQVVNSRGVLAASTVEDSGLGEEGDGSAQFVRASSVASIQEEEEEEEEVEVGESSETFKTPSQPPSQAGEDRTPPQTFTGPEVWRWRIDLARTEPHWRGWFQGLSARFLGVAGAKLLLLAGVDRLDRELTVGQMQGKFQMQVLPQVGHTVHEDSPDKVAEVLAGFLVRNKFCQAQEGFKPGMIYH